MATVSTRPSETIPSRLEKGICSNSTSQSLRLAISFQTSTSKPSSSPLSFRTVKPDVEPSMPTLKTFFSGAAP